MRASGGLWITLFAKNLLILYTISMNKDSNIRIFKVDRQLLRKLAKKEGRTLKVMFGIILQEYDEGISS
jgi:hypothetical protein